MVIYEAIIAIVLAVVITGLLGKPIIPFLKKLKFGQEIREEGPSWHKSKQGTPTMGGIIFIIPTLITTFILLLMGKIEFSDNINVITKSAELTADDAILIHTVLYEEVNASPENVKIIPIS